MNAVGIDASKGKSTVTIRRPGDIVIMSPRDIPHTQSAINALIELIRNLDGETKVCMEHTERYYEPVATWLSDAGIFVSAVNPILIKGFGDYSLRTPKTDKADSKKIARYTLDRWAKLKQYGSMDKTRNQLKTMNRQFGFYMAQKTAMKNNLIALLDQTYPGANDFFDSPARSDGSQKWVDCVHTYWHVDCVRSKSPETFSQHYQNWCKRKGYNFSADKAQKIYQLSSDLIAVFPKNDSTKLLIRQAVAMLNTASATVESLRLKMDETASALPEYPIVMAMNGVGPSLSPQLMAEIGDVARFTHRGALTAFAGVDPGKNDSGQHIQKSVPTTKKGSPSLRRTLFLIMEGLINRSPADDAVYAFMDKKRAQGKPYYVYMTTGANKFLRIYYGRVKEYLATLAETEET
jgi:transposase